MICEVGKLQRNGAWLYPLSYIAALFGVSEWSVRVDVSWYRDKYPGVKGVCYQREAKGAEYTTRILRERMRDVEVRNCNAYW